MCMPRLDDGDGDSTQTRREHRPACVRCTRVRRYNREACDGARSVLLGVMHGERPPPPTMVLLVTSLSVKQAPAPTPTGGGGVGSPPGGGGGGPLAIEVSDGWYPAVLQVDETLWALVACGAIRVSRRLLSSRSQHAAP